MTKTVTKPKKMNVIVAMKDLTDNLAKPHTPWPLVQPDPKRLPNPTNKPAMTITRLLEVISTYAIGLRIL